MKLSSMSMSLALLSASVLATTVFLGCAESLPTDELAEPVEPVEELESAELYLSESIADTGVCLDDLKECLQAGSTPAECKESLGECVPEPQGKPTGPKALLAPCFVLGKKCIEGGGNPEKCKALAKACGKKKAKAAIAKMCKNKIEACKAGELPKLACKAIVAKCSAFGPGQEPPLAESTE